MLGMTFTSPQQPGDKTRVASPEGGGGGGAGGGGRCATGLVKSFYNPLLLPCPRPDYSDERKVLL